MIITPEVVDSTLDAYSGFFDSVITSFAIVFDGERKIEVTLLCRSQSGQHRKVCLRYIGVQAWKFAGQCREAPEVVTEGIRFYYSCGQWAVDFGDDPDVSMSEENWTLDSNKWIIAKEIRIDEVGE